MRPKLAAETKRLNMVVPSAWARKVDDWRRRQPQLPNFSEAVRRLVELALDGERKGKRR